MKGIVLAILLLVMGSAITMMVRLFQRELAKLQALIVKGEQYHSDQYPSEQYHNGIADERDAVIR